MNDEINGPDTGDKSLTPINVVTPPTDDDTGFLIVELREGAVEGYDRDLGTAALASGLSQMHATLSAFNLTARPLIKALPLEGLRTESAPLKNYWRIDVRQQSFEQTEKIEQSIKKLPEVRQIYREKILTEAVNPDDDVFSQFQDYLDEEGVNARPIWDLLGAGTTGLHFIDLEQGWIRDHEDMPATTVIYNDNRDGHDGLVGDHGTAVVAIVAARDNTKGVIGIEPNPGSVRLVSVWDQTTGDMIISDAIVAAMTSQPRPDVLLIEMQVGSRSLPVEVESASFTAIREATDRGIIVVEAAGNGNQNLDGILTPQDSGAIMVGGGEAAPPHNRGLWNGGQGSNFGARVDCFAWGNGIATAGYGGLQTLGATRNYYGNFGGTSGAAAIIAGCVMLLQRLRIARTGMPLTPAEMRALLSNPATGTPQGGAVMGHIGVMPNLQAIVNSRPDLFPDISTEVELSGALGITVVHNR